MKLLIFVLLSSLATMMAFAVIIKFVASEPTPISTAICSVAFGYLLTLCVFGILFIADKLFK